MYETEVQSSKPHDCTTRRPGKRKRIMEWNTSELKYTRPLKKFRLTDSYYKQQNNTGQSKEMKYQ